MSSRSPSAPPATITLADPADVSRIEQIARRAYRKYVPRIGRAPAPMVADFAAAVTAGHAVVARASSSEGLSGEGGEIVGYAIAYPVNDVLHLENVAVDPAHHKRGFGARLVAYVEQQACDGGRTAVELYTNIHMTENITWYVSRGYRETGRRKEDGFERIFFRKDLPGRASTRRE